MEILDAKLHIDEREMDFLILEELACSPPFAGWFLWRTGYQPARASSLLSLGRSISTFDGETDLLLVHTTALGKRALLIENKVGASFTEFQPERYRIRGQAGVDKGDWQEFTTVLIAPQKYLDSAGQPPFDFRVPYEEVRQTVASHGDPSRVSFKLKLLDLAIAKAKAPSTTIPCPEVTAFCRAYRDFGLTKVTDARWQPETQLRASAPPYINFRVDPFHPLRVLIELKPSSGMVDLRVYGVPELVLKGVFPSLPLGATTAPAGKSCSIRAMAPSMNPRTPFEGQEALAEAQVAAVQSLAAFARQNEGKFATLLRDHPRT